MSKKIYLAGPMKGIPDYNYPAFAEAAQKLRDEGHEVFSPAEADIEKWGSKEACHAHFDRDRLGALRIALGQDLAYITGHATAIAVLPGWENSKGVAAELATAKALGIEEIYL
jgi:hypothetical protein